MQASKAKKIIKISLNTIFYLLLISMILFSFANMKLKESDDIANLFGRGFVSVLTGSMDGDESDSFSTKDLILVKLLDEDEKGNLAEGTIVTFYDTMISGLNQPGLITHRIVDVIDVDGQIFYQTQGDANANPDEELLNSDLVVAVYTGQIKNLGSVLKTVQSPNGFALYIILPIAIFMIFEGVILTRNILAINKDKMEKKYALEKEEALSKLEAEKEKMRQEIMKELSDKQNS